MLVEGIGMKRCSLQDRKAKAKSRRLVWDGAIRKGAKRHALEPAIWSNTPHDIQLRLLRVLPVTSRCRFRCVSKSWRSAIATSAVHTPQELWFISLYGDIVRISGDGFSWKNLAFSVPMDGDRYLNFVSTSAGLVLGTQWDVARQTWLGVYNALVPGSGRTLVPLAESVPLLQDRTNEVAFTGIQALPGTSSDATKISFAVVCVTNGPSSGFLLHVFDSRSWSWVVKAGCLLRVWDGVSETHEVLLYGQRNHNSLLLQDDRLYFLTVSRFNIRSLKSVNIWDPEHTCKTLATWTDLPLNLHQNDYVCHYAYNHPSLISCQGKIMLVNMIHIPVPGNAIGFLYLDEESGRWRELKTFPVDPFPAKVLEKNLKHRNKGYVWAAGSRESSKVALFFVKAWWGCVFDVADSTWRGAFSKEGEVFQPFHPSLLTF